MLMNCRVSYIVIYNVFLTVNFCEVEYNLKKVCSNVIELIYQGLFWKAQTEVKRSHWVYGGQRKCRVTDWGPEHIW